MPNMSPKKVPMPEQAPEVRNQNFEEVSLGYTAEMALSRLQAPSLRLGLSRQRRDP